VTGLKSFKKILVRNFTGMIFLILLSVFLFFNVLMNNFISAEAHRELMKSVADIENRATYVGIHPRRVFFGGLPPLESPEALEDFLTQWMQQIQMGSLRSLNQIIMNVDGFILNEHHEIISPNQAMLSENDVTEIVYMANYYIENRGLFEGGAMVRVAGSINAYYLAAIQFPVTADTYFSVLLYTDITSAIMFMRNINQRLGGLLIISGILSIIVSILMSSQVQNAIVRLCRYAEVIGHGNFEEKVENFTYKEFNDLAQSMNNMSNKLSVYENNQKRFFQNVSHELRTPLMSIQGYAEGILENVLDKEEASEIILSESERMERLVSQLLYISRMDSGLDSLNITTFCIKNMLYDSAWRYKILAEKNGKEIILDFPETDTEIKSDEEKLQRIVDNILTNCIRHANSSVRLAYTATASEIKILVEDDGGGIDKMDLPHIFERFYKGANGNSGLGLAICKDIAEKLGGDIKAENVAPPLTGARFSIFVYP